MAAGASVPRQSSVGRHVLEGMAGFFGGLFGDEGPHCGKASTQTRKTRTCCPGAGGGAWPPRPLERGVGDALPRHSLEHEKTLLALQAELAKDEAGSSGRPRSVERSAGPVPYEADAEDLLDQHVAYYLRHHPDVQQRRSVKRKVQGSYEVDGREIQVEWQYAAEPGGQGCLIVVDGPMRQPFCDYMEETDKNVEYDSQTVTSSSSLHQIPRDKRVSFGDEHKVYTRLEAMKVAKEQASVREQAAECVRDGRTVPENLMTQYEKSIRVKLGQGRRRQERPPSPGKEAAPSASPPTTAPPPTSAPPPASAPPHASAPPPAPGPPLGPQAVTPAAGQVPVPQSNFGVAPPLAGQCSAPPPAYGGAPAAGGPWQVAVAWHAPAAAASVTAPAAAGTMAFPWMVHSQAGAAPAAQGVAFPWIAATA